MLLALLLLTINSVADVEVVGGSLTYHLIDYSNAVQYSNKLSNDGRLIDNPILGIQYVKESRLTYESIGVFTGENSIGKDILGLKLSTGEKMSNLYLGVVIGAYEQSTKSFRDKNIVPFQVGQVGDVGIVPLVGVELNYKIKVANKIYVKINNVVTPILTNSTISLGFSY